MKGENMCCVEEESPLPMKESSFYKEKKKEEDVRSRDEARRL